MPRLDRPARLTHLAEVGALEARRQAQDVLAVLGLASAWRVSGPHEIVAALADAMVRLVRLDVAAVRVHEPDGGDLEAAIPTGLDLQEAFAVGADAPRTIRLPRPNTVGATEARCVALVPAGERGLVVAGSWRKNFPTPHEALLLSTLADQAALALQSCRERRARTQLEAARAEAEAHRDRAREADRRKDLFLAMLGHELRNPLAPIVAALETMRLRDPGPSARERLVIERHVSHVRRLVDDLLDISAIAKGRVSISRRPVEAADLVLRAVEMVRPLLDQRGLELVTMLPSGPIVLDADPERMVQVLVNLLQNAAKYSEPRKRVDLVVEADETTLTVRVRDQGIGIAPDLLPRIFEAFVQGERRVHEAKGGLGLGLPIARRLVELHGGQLTARSDGPGHGSELVVKLPRAPVTALVSDEPGPSYAPGLRVLVVDDNVDAADTLAEALGLCGFVARAVHDGATAMRILGDADPDVVLVDIGLPGMDGFELAGRIRAARGEAVRLVALTGYGQDRDRARTRAAHFDAHLVKPVDLNSLVAAISSAASVR